MRRLLAVLAVGLALAGPAAAADYNEAMPQLPPDRAPRLCAQRQVEIQAQWMRNRGWLVEPVYLRTWTQGAFFGDTVLNDGDLGTPVAGATFQWNGGWVLILSPRSERLACRTLRIMRERKAWVPLDDTDGVDVIFHELLHQTWNEGADQGHRLVVPRARIMTHKYVRAYEIARAKAAREYFAASELNLARRGITTG